MRKEIKHIISPSRLTMGNLDVQQPMPSGRLQHLDPFLLLHHLGPQKMEPGHSGLPFEPHPHKGFETVTIVLEGDVVHEDSAGFRDAIRAGGVQWMTAGKGILHKEDNSEEFKQKGGIQHFLQLWLNLPKRLKNVAPDYQGLQKESIPEINFEGGRIRVIAGEYENQKGPADTLTDVNMYLLALDRTGSFQTSLDADRNVLLYQLEGTTEINGEEVSGRRQVVFHNEGEEIHIDARKKSLMLFASGTPFRENIVAQGPFVMNTKNEILEAMEEYRSGKLGVWNKEDE